MTQKHNFQQNINTTLREMAKLSEITISDAFSTDHHNISEIACCTRSQQTIITSSK